MKLFKIKLKNNKGGFRPVLSGTLVASVLGNALSRRGVARTGENFECRLIL